MVFKEKKKKYFIVFLAFFLFSGVIFAFSDVQYVFAAGDSTNCFTSGDFWDCAGDKFSSVGGEIAGVAGDVIAAPFKALLYAFFVFAGWLASAALTLFEWVIKPENISGDSGLLNQPNIYEMWQFIRDFFNLFFILVLLYIAFTVVFQIQKNFKKALLSLILAALLVNFSYPISRLLIDVTNVPMYFFANQISGIDAASGIFGQSLSVSGLQGILLPGSENGLLGVNWSTDLEQFLAAAVFMFLFAITLVVLAVMFIVRLVALMILVVFSSVGFVAAIIPGMKEYSDMWWKNFWKYTLFGPAAMLMLLVATRFFSAMGDKNAGVFAGLKRSAGDVSADPTFIASLAMFSFPIIVLWMAIGLGQKMGMMGAASISGKGEKFAKWAGRKTYDNSIGRGLAGGAKKAVDEGKYFGHQAPKLLTPKGWRESSKKTEADIKGFITGGKKGVQKAQEQRKNDASKEHFNDMLDNDISPADIAAAIADTRNDEDTEARRKAAMKLNALDPSARALLQAARTLAGAAKKKPKKDED